MSGKAGIEEVVDELLALPPGQFTEARNAAAKRLTADGRREEAAEIKGLSRPSVALWALNRLAREQASLLETFLTAAEALRKAHRTRRRHPCRDTARACRRGSRSSPPPASSCAPTAARRRRPSFAALREILSAAAARRRGRSRAARRAPAARAARRRRSTTCSARCRRIPRRSPRARRRRARSGRRATRAPGEDRRREDEGVRGADRSAQGGRRGASGAARVGACAEVRRADAAAERRRGRAPGGASAAAEGALGAFVRLSRCRPARPCSRGSHRRATRGR